MDIMLQSLVSDPANRNMAAKLARMQHQIQQMQAAGIAMAQEDTETAQNVLADIDVLLLPKAFQAVRWIHQANLDLYNANYDAVLSACDRIESLQDDVPLVLFLRAAAHNGLGQHDRAITLIQEYLQLLGADVHAYLQLGTALAGLDRKPEALDAYRTGLDEDANSVDTLYNLGLLLAADEVDEVGQRFMQMARPAENFETLAQAFLDGEAVEALEAVVGAYAAKAKNDPNTGYYLAQVHVARGEFEAAAAAIEAVLLRADSVSYRIDPRLISSLIHLQRLDEALEIAGGIDENFWYLAQIHAARGNVPETAANLLRLVQEGYLAEDFYDDEILGRALRSDALRELRKEYPPPAEPEAEPPAEPGAESGH